MKIRYTSLDESTDLAPQKRTNVSLICQDNKKKRKVNKPEPEVLMAEEKDIVKPSEKDEFLNSEIERVSRSEQIMKNLFNALWTVSKQKLLESESAAKSMQELLRDKDTQIIELKKELEDLKSHRVKFPIVEDTPVEQNDAASLGPAALSSVSQSNQTDLGSSDTALDDFHSSTELVEKVSEESTYYDPEMSSAYCDMTEKPVDCDTSVANLTDEQELSSRCLKKEESSAPDAFEPNCDVKEGNTEVIMGQVVNKESDSSEQTSAPDGGVTRAPSPLDHPSDLSYTELCIVPCNLSTQFTEIQVSKKAPMEQSEEEELSSNTEVENIQHDVDIKEMKQHDRPSSPQQANSDAEDVSSDRPSLELKGVGAAQQKNPDEPVPEPERREPTVEEPEYAHGQRVPDEGLPQEKASTASTKGCQAEGAADAEKENRRAEGVTNDDNKKEDICASQPRENTKKTTRRRLLPVAAMMLKDFTGPAIDAATDTTRRDGIEKSSAAGRSDALIRLLKVKASPMAHRRN